MAFDMKFMTFASTADAMAYLEELTDDAGPFGIVSHTMDDDVGEDMEAEEAIPEAGAEAEGYYPPEEEI